MEDPFKNPTQINKLFQELLDLFNSHSMKFVLWLRLIFFFPSRLLKEWFFPDKDVTDLQIGSITDKKVTICPKLVTFNVLFSDIIPSSSNANNVLWTYA